MNIIRLNSIGEPFAKSGQATPPSGGGTEGGMKLLCFNCPVEGLTVNDLGDFFGNINALVKLTSPEGELIGPFGMVDKSLVVKSIAVVEGMKTVSYLGIEYIVSRQLIESVTGDLASFIITEEEFYTL